MIYTVTFNPSLDYIVQVEAFQTGRVNRTSSEQLLPGGKGINVSIVLKNLGIETTALGFLAGFTGKEIEERIREYGCRTDFTWLLKGHSRINLKLKSAIESEINGQGPDISEEALMNLYEKLSRLTDEDMLVLAGSIPASLPSSIYQQIMSRLTKKNLKIIVDASGDLLLQVLKYHPFLIKPNNHELSELFDIPLTKEEDYIACGLKLQEKGAKNVLISLAGAGAILITEQGEVIKSKAPKGKVVNSVGAGDSMVAGFITGYLETGNYGHALKMGIAAGSSSAFSSQLATKAEVTAMLEKMENKVV
ncbi:tagatose-6-phosphate kinase [Anaerocolumna cellulosilytica]|uniref:Tagatose-6-phosphate kinase n=1 Tax=Anaerocolumna cellulosilytica TaxID=433286 RepID=A0A6S6R2S7_9FIRM|nr:1-phosphofructokinase [Anaerocolumna cellulosilytica]MBB5194661.1 1-phosphofructokinase [Anaerocolumna cellulosilytica]BCJ94377.1 tagatose-6-phosphate kinase [Anaerocolumna cellulosilytica]